MFKPTPIIIKNPDYIRDLMSLTLESLKEINIENQILLEQLEACTDDDETWWRIDEQIGKNNFLRSYLLTCYEYYESELKAAEVK